MYGTSGFEVVPGSEDAAKIFKAIKEKTWNSSVLQSILEMPKLLDFVETETVCSNTLPKICSCTHFITCLGNGKIATDISVSPSQTSPIDTVAYSLCLQPRRYHLRSNRCKSEH